jgi:hypothetical protein
LADARGDARGDAIWTTALHCALRGRLCFWVVRRRARRDAVMLGPTLYVQFTPKMFMTAAWNTQVWSREIGNPLSLNLAEFQRNPAKLKFAVEF